MAQYGTTEVAQQCSVSLNTVRAWARDYAAFLSASATGSRGDRVFTQHDLNVLKYVAQLRSERMQRDAILIRLGETTFPEIDDQTDSATPVATLSEPAVTAITSAVGLPVNAMDRYITRDEIERLVSLVREESRPRYWWFALGLGAGLGLAVVAELFALVARR